MANGRKLNEVTNVSTLASSDRIVTVRTSDGKTVQISLTDFMNTLIGGLGTAATHDVTTSNTDTTSGRVLKVRDFGVGYADLSRPVVDFDDLATEYPYSGLVPLAPHSSSTNGPAPSSQNYVQQFRQSSTNILQVAWPYWSHISSHKFAFRGRGGAGWQPWQEVLSTLNTTVDSNGFVKQASPIVKLYSDRVEVEGFGQETPTMTRVSKGVYEITGTSGLAQKGWTIETPKNRNGEVYFNIDWEQDSTPEVDENGQVSEPQNVTLTITTFKRVWNMNTGQFDNGDPVDIEEAAGEGRFVTLRFTEVKPVEEEPEGEEGEE